MNNCKQRIRKTVLFFRVPKKQEIVVFLTIYMQDLYVDIMQHVGKDKRRPS